jgi:hypothetical protein
MGHARHLASRLGIDDDVVTANDPVTSPAGTGTAMPGRSSARRHNQIADEIVLVLVSERYDELLWCEDHLPGRTHWSTLGDDAFEALRFCGSYEVVYTCHQGR